MRTSIILWTPNKINFEEIFSASEQFPEADFSKSRMLIILSLLKPDFKGGLLNLKFPSMLKRELKVDVVKYLSHLRSKGVAEFNDESGISESADGLRINPIYAKGKYWRFFVSISAGNGFNKLLARLNAHPRKNGVSKNHVNWFRIPFNRLTSIKTVIPMPLNN